jgi:hypothetical protein
MYGSPMTSSIDVRMRRPMKPIQPRARASVGRIIRLNSSPKAPVRLAPSTGSQSSQVAKMRSRKIAITKLGTAMKATEVNARMLSRTDPRCVGRIDAERNSDQRGQAERRERKDQRVGQHFADQLRDRAPRDDVDAEIAPRDVGEEPPQSVSAAAGRAPISVMKRRDNSGVAWGPNSVVAGSPGTTDVSVNRQQHRSDHDQHGRDEAAPEIPDRLFEARRASREH